jgi:alkanesulfonate monooxygenase SsuD/methylene tetrahydromethanopterin reductase-like flavin-dependent oxidoreductase (luciferase family)
MRCGMSLYIQGYQDWDRYQAKERGEDAPALDPEFDRKRLSSEIETALEAEDLGFDSLWALEHHISPYCMITNPLQLLTFFAGATSRIDVGTMVVVVPWHHPLRVAEEITMLQYALRGRTPYIGFGRGTARREFRQLGIDMNESKERLAEGVEVIRLALTEEMFSYSGKHYQLENITMRPRPLDPQALIDNFHFSWGSPTSPPVGARLGLKPLMVPQKPWAEYPPELAAFDHARHDAGHSSARPRIHMVTYVGETHEQAEAAAKRHISEYAMSALNHYELTGSHFAGTKGYEHYAAMAPHYTADAIAASYVDNHAWGTPDECIAKIKGVAEAFHPEEFMFAFRYGSMSKEMAEKNMRLFATEVLPAVHEMGVQEPVVYTEGADASAGFTWQLENTASQ